MKLFRMINYEVNSRVVSSRNPTAYPYSGLYDNHFLAFLCGFTSYVLVSEIGCCKHDRTSGKDVPMPSLNSLGFPLLIFPISHTLFLFSIHFPCMGFSLARLELGYGTSILQQWCHRAIFGFSLCFSSCWGSHLPSAFGVHTWCGLYLCEQGSCWTGRRLVREALKLRIVPTLAWATTHTSSSPGLLTACHMVNMKRSCYRFFQAEGGEAIPTVSSYSTLSSQKSLGPAASSPLKCIFHCFKG